MTHVIYCYFIINAFIAGTMFEYNGKWPKVILMLAVGLPAIIIGQILDLLEKVDKIVEARFLFFVIFTDRYRSWAEDSECCQMLREWYTELNSYKRWVIRLWAKKYGVKL